MDPFGDNSDSGDLNAFQPPADASSYSNDFYEVDSGEAATDAHAPADDSFSFGDDNAAAAPAHDDNDLNASYTQDSFASSSNSGSRTTSFEHQQQQHSGTHSASHSTTHSASNSRHSSFQAAASASGGSRTSSFGQGAASSIPAIEEENELTKFMREYEQRIAEKAQEQAKVALESKDKAQSDMAQFVSERSRIKESKQQANRVHEQATLEKLAADLEAENPWERVVSLVELEANRKQKLAALQAATSSKSKDAQQEPPKAAKKTGSDDDEDVSRMRQLFVQLKAEPLEQTRGAAATH